MKATFFVTLHSSARGYVNHRGPTPSSRAIIPRTSEALPFLFSLVLLLSFSTVLTATGRSADSWKFIVAGDSRGSDNGVNTTILAEIATQVIGQGAEFILFPGDLVSGYTNEATLESQLRTWRDTMQPVYSSGIGVYPIRGNHEYGGNYATPTAWRSVFSGAYSLPGNGPSGEEDLTWSITHGTGSSQAILLGLDQYYPSKDHTVPQAWIDEKLAASAATHVFAMGHEPAFSSDHGDCLDDAPTARNIFLSSLLSAGGRSYFVGHDHFYNHLRADDGDGDPNNDLHQFIVGTAGAPLRSEGDYGGNTGPWTPTKDTDGDGLLDPGAFEKQYGYMVVEIDRLDVTMTWWHRTGINTYSATSEGLSYTVPGPKGDFDFDGDVEGVDFLAWQRGESPSPGSDGDLAHWQANYGIVADPAIPTSLGVPEPTTGLLLLLGWAAIFRGRPRNPKEV